MHQLSSDQRYRLLANHAVEHAMILLDAAGEIVEWSRGAELLLGWSAQEAIGQPASMIFTPEDRATDAPKTELGTALALGRSSDVRWHLRKDGSTVFCDGIVNAILDADGVTVIGFGKVMREAFSMRKEKRNGRHHAGSEGRSFLAAVLESVENGIVACDPAGRLTFFNEAARAIHGLDEQPLPFDQWAQHYHLYHADARTPLGVDEIPLYRALRGERVEGAQIVVMTPGGERRDVQVSGRALLDGVGQVLGAVISMNDVSALRSAIDARDETTREQGKRIAAEASEDRVRKTQAQLHLAAEAAQLGIWTWDVTRDQGTWENARMYDIFNIAPGNPIVTAEVLLRDYLHPDDAPAFRQAADDAVRNGTRFHFTGRFHRLPARDVHWLELSGIAQRDDAGSTIMIGTAADVTARKQDEEALRDARIRIEATLSAGEVASWIWDIRRDRLTADRNLASLFGVPPNLATDAPLERFTASIHPDDLDEVSRQIRLAIDAKQPYRATYRVTDSVHGYRWINARGRVDFDEHGEPTLLAGVTIDITQQKEMQDQLRVTEERYRTLITSIDEAFGIVQVLVDEQGEPCDYRFEEVNASMQKQSGLVDAAGKTIREMVPDIEPKWIARYGQVALSRQAIRFTEHSAAMGYWWDVYAMPIGEPEELRIGILFTDVTARRQAEEALRQLAADLSEANRRKTEFLATLAHELRNPLAPLRTGLDLMRLAPPGTQAGARVHEMMDRQLRQMVHLIDDLMDVSRINSGKIVLQRRILDLQDAVTNAVEAALPSIEAARHAFDVALPDQAVRLHADPTRLAQILGNLLTNAVKYTPPGGSIRLSARLEDGMVAIAVADTGMGIPREEQAHVFELFSQVSRNMGRAQGGLGIGLSLVRSLVEMHGGSVAVDSAGPGQGTTFTIRLPVTDAGGERHTDGAAAPAASPQPAGLRIVVADDNVDAASLLSSLLEASGHAAEAVHNGAQALGRILALRPDLAILDIGMPGLNGYEVAERIRAAPGMEAMVLVALTGWGGELDRNRSASAGFDTHLTKPAGLADLEQALLLARARRARAEGA
ncbi:PAS domain S-box protein [Massilia sp.]|uniref:hybrid sensor histidine kinase/response regulator n=1 Tax=Massilia sp. TaxID=1882437 RepID=UPI0028B10100|nr:PAS domain S-box protein [Massilia sp.]